MGNVSYLMTSAEYEGVTTSRQTKQPTTNVISTEDDMVYGVYLINTLHHITKVLLGCRLGHNVSSTDLRV